MREAGSLLEQRLQAAESERNRLRQTTVTSLPAASTPPSGVAAARLKGPTLSAFNGTMGFEVDAWLRSARKIFDYHGASAFPDDESRIGYVSLFLEGPALTWWDTVDKDGVKTWEDFVALLHRRWKPRLAAEVARQKIAMLKQRGTVSQLCNALLQLLAHVPTMHEDDRIFHFKQALSAPIAAKVAELKPGTLEEAMQVAVQAELYVGRPGATYAMSGGFYRPSHSGPGGARNAASSSAAPMELSNIDQPPQEETEDAAEVPTQEELLALWKEVASRSKESTLNALFARGRSGARKSGSGAKVPDVTKEAYERCRAENRCLKCKEVGHIARDCKKPFRLNF